MVIEFLDTVVANRTMRASRRPENVAWRSLVPTGIAEFYLHVAISGRHQVTHPIIGMFLIWDSVLQLATRNFFLPKVSLRFEGGCLGLSCQNKASILSLKARKTSQSSSTRQWTTRWCETYCWKDHEDQTADLDHGKSLNQIHVIGPEWV